MPRTRALLFVALVSGAAALIYQAVWLRWFQLLFGSTAYAASATLSAFFAGLALGAVAGGRLALRLRRPLRGYAAIEVGAAALALAVPLVFRLYDPVYAALYDQLADRRAVFLAIKFALALAVMVPPAVLLGATLPLLATAYVDDPDRLGSAGGRLYAVNTFGAAAGSAAGVLWLPDAIGIPATYGAAIALSLAAAAGAYALDRPPARGPHPAPPPAAAPAPRSLVFVAFASGFGTLALEVLLIRALAQLFDHSVYSYGAVLVVVLLALAAGAALVSFAVTRVSARALLGGALAVESALLLVLPFALSRVTGLGEAGPGALASGLLWTALLGGPPLLVGALVLPLTFELGAGGPVGPRLGGLLAANTVGGIAGSIAASFALLDWLGLWPSLAAVGLGYGVAALVVEGSLRERATRAAVAAGAGLAVWGAGAGPTALPVVALAPGESLVAYDEGAYGVVSVIDGPFGRRMKLDNHYTLSGAGRLAVIKERAGHIPLLLHPAPRRAAFVGSATGNTASAALDHPLEEIVLVELVPEVQQLAAAWFAESNRGIHHDPRTRLVVEDGRNHLRATRETYDVVVADLFAPWRPGVGALYTIEHFRAVREHLAPGGVFCQWLPIYQHTETTFETVAATFLDVFPNAGVWRADFFARTVPRVALIGFRDEPPGVEVVEARVRELAAAGVADPWVTDPRAFWMFHSGPLAVASARLGDAPRNSDATPVFEFRAGRGSALERRAFLRTRWPAFAAALLEGAPPDAPFAAVLERGRDGLALSRAGALALDDDRAALREALLRLRSRVPAELLELRDPSVSELWMAR